MKKIIIILSILILTLATFAGSLYYFSDFQEQNSNVVQDQDIEQDNIYPINYVIYGDTRNGHDIHEHIVQQILNIHPVAVFHTGDLVEHGGDSNEWGTFLEITEDLRENTKFFPVFGNHERSTKLFLPLFKLLSPWYVVNLENSNIEFIMIDSNTDLSSNSVQYQWLESTLQAISEDKLKIIIMHHPLYTVSSHKPDEIKNRDLLIDLFKKYNVQLVFSGHNHVYERFNVDSITYIVTGGGGAPLYDKYRDDPNLVTFQKTYNFIELSEISRYSYLIKVIDTDGKVIDNFEIRLNN